MHRPLHLFATLLCTLLVGVTVAEDAPAPGGPQPVDGPSAPGPGGPGSGGPGSGMRGPGFGFPLPPFPLLQTLDADQDGKLSAVEISGAVAALKKLDQNRDGKLSPDEIGWPPAGMGRGGPGGGFMRGPGRRAGFGPQGMNRGAGGPGSSSGGAGESQPPASFVERIMGHDENHDGKVTPEELPERMRWMVQRLDMNRDGALDRGEAEAAAAPRARRKPAGPESNPGEEQPMNPASGPDGT